jgi:hypothetical protein
MKKRAFKQLPTPLKPLDLHLNRKTPRHPHHLNIAGDDELAKELGEEYVRSVTSGEHMADDIRDEEVPEEHGGPFVTTPAWVELAAGTDESNPEDAEVSPLPDVSVLRPR